MRLQATELKKVEVVNLEVGWQQKTLEITNLAYSFWNSEYGNTSSQNRFLDCSDRNLYCHLAQAR